MHAVAHSEVCVSRSHFVAATLHTNVPVHLQHANTGYHMRIYEQIMYYAFIQQVITLQLQCCFHRLNKTKSSHVIAFSEWVI